MSTNIVQSVLQKCLELHNFVPIFLKIFWGSTPRPPFHLYFLRMCFKKLRHFYMLKRTLQVFRYRPFSLKKNKKKNCGPPLF